MTSDHIKGKEMNIKDTFSSLTEAIEASHLKTQPPRPKTEDRNCLSWWFPKLRDAGLPLPRTHIFHTDDNLVCLMDGETPPMWTKLLVGIKDAGDELGWPVFFRTGQGSGKHNWQSTCYLTRPEDIGQHIVNLVAWSHTVDFFGLAHDVWVVREMLPVAPLFVCTRYGGMPVVREFRAFVENSRVAYIQPYWPKGAIKEGSPDDDNWEAKYARLDMRPEDTSTLRALASTAGLACGGCWSVDLLETRNGWYVTDMAIAERSWGFDPQRFAENLP